MLSITVEVNPPHEGENHRTAGVFLRDGAGRVHVAHSGKIGGGRPGVGKRAFRDFSSHLAWQDIETPRGIREVLVVGPLHDKAELPERIASFVRTVATFKDATVKRRRR